MEASRKEPRILVRVTEAFMRKASLEGLMFCGQLASSVYHTHITMLDL